MALRSPAVHVIAFESTPARSTLARLTRMGAEVVAYLPTNVFIIETAGAAADQLTNLPGVIALTEYQPDWSLSPRLAHEQAGLIAISLDPGRRPALVLTELAIRGIEGHQAGTRIIAYVDRPILTELAALPGVSWIAPLDLPQTLNDEASGIIGVTAANSNGYDGTGQIIAITDTGIGDGTSTGAHRDIPSNRIVAIHDYPASSFAGCWTAHPDGTQDVDSGHGTHVTGSVLSSGDGSGYGTGMAPKASLVFQAVEDYIDYNGACSLFTDGYLLTGLSDFDFEDILDDAFGDGARIHSNSWGSDVNGEYIDSSVSADT